MTQELGPQHPPGPLKKRPQKRAKLLRSTGRTGEPAVMADSRVASPATHMEPIPPSIDGKGGRKFSSSQAVLFQDAAKPGAVETERASSLYTSDAVDESKSHVLDEDGGFGEPPARWQHTAGSV